jgi:hypothetical protein
VGAVGEDFVAYVGVRCGFVVEDVIGAGWDEGVLPRERWMPFSRSAAIFFSGSGKRSTENWKSGFQSSVNRQCRGGYRRRGFRGSRLWRSRSRRRPNFGRSCG